MITLLLVFLNQVHANVNNYNLKEFDHTLNLSRGSISPKNTGGYYLEYEDACNLAIKVWGWSESNCKSIDAMLISPSLTVDAAVFNVAIDSGYISYDDWKSSDRDKRIESIWNQAKEQYEIQSKRINLEMEMIKWLVYPTLVEDKNYIYYAFLLKVGDETIPNIRSALFDRSGFISVQMVPYGLSEFTSETEFKKTVESVLDLYISNSSMSYDDYRSGDKVAEYGVLGVLATLAGVKWGKAALTGITATILIFAKKFWWVLFLPFYFLFRKIFKRKD